MNCAFCIASKIREEISIFESIISEAQKKLNLGDKAGGLLSTLLVLMANKADGGFSGFLERFTTAGSGDLTKTETTNAMSEMPTIKI